MTFAQQEPGQQALLEFGYHSATGLSAP